MADEIGSPSACSPSRRARTGFSEQQSSASTRHRGHDQKKPDLRKRFSAYQNSRPQAAGRVQPGRASRHDECRASSPRGLSFASPGPGTPGHVAVELLRARTKSWLNHVPFEGGGPALDALMDGRVDMYFAVLPSAMPHVTSGKLKILGV